DRKFYSASTSDYFNIDNALIFHPVSSIDDMISFEKMNYIAEIHKLEKLSVALDNELQNYKRFRQNQHFKPINRFEMLPWITYDEMHIFDGIEVAKQLSNKKLKFIKRLKNLSSTGFDKNNYHPGQLDLTGGYEQHDPSYGHRIILDLSSQDNSFRVELVRRIGLPVIQSQTIFERFWIPPFKIFVHVSDCGDRFLLENAIALASQAKILKHQVRIILTAGNCLNEAADQIFMESKLNTKLIYGQSVASILSSSEKSPLKHKFKFDRIDPLYLTVSAMLEQSQLSSYIQKAKSMVRTNVQAYCPIPFVSYMPLILNLTNVTQHKADNIMSLKIGKEYGWFDEYNCEYCAFSGRDFRSAIVSENYRHEGGSVCSHLAVSIHRSPNPNIRQYYQNVECDGALDEICERRRDRSIASRSTLTKLLQMKL
ncbi:hypothetical protein GJ496_011424, partial [Pomphorhynchus laevis]